MNLTRAQKARLGAFMLTGSLLLALSLMILAGFKLWKPQTLYKARFKESVSGLDRSAPVKYQGLRIGRVEAMHVAPDDSEVIEVILAIETRTPLHEGTQAMLDSTGLTGLKTINLVPGDPRARVLPPGSLLPTGASLMDRMTQQAATIVTDVKRVADQMADWTNATNRQRLEKLVVNLDAFVTHLDSIMSESRAPFNDVLRDVSHAANAMTQAAHQADRTMQLAYTSLESTSQTLRATLQAWARPFQWVDPEQVAQTVGAVHQAANKLSDRLSDQEAGQAMATLGKTLSRVNHLVQDIDLGIQSGREDVTASLSYIRQAAEDLREFSRILAQNPSVLVRGRREVDE